MELEIITDRQTDQQTDMRDHRKVSAVILDERSVRNLSRSIICSKLSLRDTDHS